MLNTLGALFKHLHFLIAKCHVVEHDEQVVHVSPAVAEVDCIHDAIRLLEQVESSFVLILLDEGNGTFVEFSQDNRDLVLGHS